MILLLALPKMFITVVFFYDIRKFEAILLLENSVLDNRGYININAY